MMKKRVKIAKVKQLIFTTDEFYYLVETLESCEVYLIKFSKAKMTLKDQITGITNYAVGDEVAIINKKIVGRHRHGVIIPN